MSEDERIIRLEERLRQIMEEHVSCRDHLKTTNDELRDIQERIARAEQNHESLEKAVSEMKTDLKEQLTEFKSTLGWAVGTGITLSSVLVSVLAHFLGR